MIFRASRVFLNSINRLVNTKKHTCDFGEEFTAFKEVIFHVYSFPFYFILGENTFLTHKVSVLFQC
jgi:hypothetical protein